MSNKTTYMIYVFGPKTELDGTVIPHAMQGCARVYSKADEIEARKSFMTHYPTATELIVEHNPRGEKWTHRKTWVRNDSTNNKWAIKA